MEALANPSWQIVVLVIATLALVRLTVGRLKAPAAKRIGEVAESLAIAIFLVFVIIRPTVVQAYYIPSGSMRPTLLESDRILVNKLIYRFREPRRGDVVVFQSPPAAKKDEKDFVKRVVGVPGDEIRVKPGYVMIGQEQYHHPELRAMLMRYSTGTNILDMHVKLTAEGAFVDGEKMTQRQIAAAAGQPEARVVVHPGVVLRNGKPLNESYVSEDPDRPYPVDTDDAFRVRKGFLFVMGDNRNESSDSRVWGLLDRQRMRGKAMFIFWPPNRVRWLK